MNSMKWGLTPFPLLREIKSCLSARGLGPCHRKPLSKTASRKFPSQHQNTSISRPNKTPSIAQASFSRRWRTLQWDRLLQTDIISKEYLEGCYKLGQQYPDLCSSIFLMCERGSSKS